MNDDGETREYMVRIAEHLGQEINESIEMNFTELSELFRDFERYGSELVKNHPLTIGNEELRTLFSTGILYFKNFERLVKSFTTDSFVVLIPTVHSEEIKSFEEIVFLILKVMPEIIGSDDYKSLLGNAFDHFRLLETLPEMVTREQVEYSAKELDINERDAVEWAFTKLPLLYALIECNLPESESYLVIINVRRYLKKQRFFIQGGRTN